MADQKNQHFVPKSYIKNFSGDEDKKSVMIWLPNQDKIIPRASIKGQCSKDYFYGEDRRVENWLQNPDALFPKISSESSRNRRLNNKLDIEFKFFWLVQNIRAEKKASSLIFFGTMVFVQFLRLKTTRLK